MVLATHTVSLHGPSELSACGARESRLENILEVGVGGPLLMQLVSVCKSSGEVHYIRDGT